VLQLWWKFWHQPSFQGKMYCNVMTQDKLAYELCRFRWNWTWYETSLWRCILCEDKWLILVICVLMLSVFVVLCICCAVYMLYCVYVVLCICCTVYLLYCVLCICCTVSIDVFPLDAELLASGQYPEGPATGHLDTGFSWFPRVFKQMLRWFPTLPVATTCFSCSPPDVNLVANLSHVLYMC
jgi:hypothetical protein